MLPLLGYTDRLSVRPGDTIRFMVSCDQPSYRSQLVRVIHGDTNPAGPGFRQEVVASSIDSLRPGKHEDIRAGSYAHFDIPAGALTSAFSFAVFVQPWNPGDGDQVIAGQGNPHTGESGWALALNAQGGVEIVIADNGARTCYPVARAVARWQWYFLAVSVDVELGRVTVWNRSVRPLPGEEPACTVSVDIGGAISTSDAPLILAGTLGSDGRTSCHFDGKLDRPRLFAHLLDDAQASALASDPDVTAAGMDPIAAWDFSQSIETDTIVDTSGNGHHGHLVNMPTRAVTGYNYSGSETDFRLARDEYGAIHFHRDDLLDAGWAADFEFTVPPDLPSGIYAAWLRAGEDEDEDEDYLPFVVCPPRNGPRSRIAVLMSTMTYLVYENFTDLGKGVWKADSSFVGNALTHPFADPLLASDVFAYIDENSLYGPYDVHVDGSGVCYASLLKPILNIRPKFRYRVMGVPCRLGADLYLTDWLDHLGIEVDYLTDHELHEQGAELLESYAVVVSSSHHEYWTTPMMHALRQYLDQGGRLMYLGGNSFYGVVSVDPNLPHAVEVRRWGTSWPFEVPPAERHHSTTGEPGGTWRNRGHGPHHLLGMGTAGAGFDRGSPYLRQPDSYDPRVSFIFDGLADDELIGDVPSLQLRWGAAGYEFDRVDVELGSPATTLLLASSNRFNESHVVMNDDRLWFSQGRDGATVGDRQVPGQPHRFARSDLSYLEYPRGGAVFSAGAISWRACLSALGYDNSVSRVTENVLRRFADTPAGVSPSDPAQS